MAGVITACVTDHAVNVSGKVVDNLPLALVTPLATNNGVCRHP
jgi:hypothetical protein